jgi:predicted dehydrogenase
MKKEKVNWGIIGLGVIAHKFCEGLGVAKNACIYAVASRSLEKAIAFGEKYGAIKNYGQYDELIADPAVDIIYIATPHPQHFEIAKAALLANKAVLCEKPVTINHSQASELIEIAKRNKVFFMEAMWTHCFPLVLKLKDLLNQKVIGEIQSLEVNFCFKIKSRDERSRAFNPDLGGGALLDVGVYNIAMAYLILGKPETIESTVVIGSTGVDEENEIVFHYQNQIKAKLSSSFNNPKTNNLVLKGSKGEIIISEPFWQPTKLKIITNQPIEEDFPMRANGYEYEAEEAMLCLQKGLIESPLVKHSQTLEIMKIMDNLRKNWGVKYPME